MNGAGCVRKGKVFEREVAERFREAMPGCDARRGLCQPRGGGRETADVVVPFFHVECKVGAQPNIARAIEQALEDCCGNDHLYPLAVTKRDRCTPLATMPLDDFLALVHEWYTLKMGVQSNDAETDQG